MDEENQTEEMRKKVELNSIPSSIQVDKKAFESFKKFQQQQKAHQTFYNKRYARFPINRLLIKEIHELKGQYPSDIQSVTAFLNESVIQGIKNFRTKKTREAKEAEQ